MNVWEEIETSPTSIPGISPAQRLGLFVVCFMVSKRVRVREIYQTGPVGLNTPRVPYLELCAPMNCAPFSLFSPCRSENHPRRRAPSKGSPFPPQIDMAGFPLC